MSERKTALVVFAVLCGFGLLMQVVSILRGFETSWSSLLLPVGLFLLLALVAACSSRPLYLLAAVIGGVVAIAELIWPAHGTDNVIYNRLYALTGRWGPATLFAAFSAYHFRQAFPKKGVKGKITRGSEALGELGRRLGMAVQGPGEVASEWTYMAMGRAVGRRLGYEAQVFMLGGIALDGDYRDAFTVIDIRTGVPLPKRTLAPPLDPTDELDRALAPLVAEPARVWLHEDRLTLVPGARRAILLSDPEQLVALLERCLSALGAIGAVPVQDKPLALAFVPLPTPPPGFRR